MLHAMLHSVSVLSIYDFFSLKNTGSPEMLGKDGKNAREVSEITVYNRQIWTPLPRPLSA